MERFLQYVFDGLSAGSVYSLLALSLVVVYRGTGHLNFAQGEMAMFSAFVAWQLHSWGLPLWLATVGAVVFGFVLGGAAEIVLVRPVAKKSPYAVFMVTIGFFLVLGSLASATWGALPQEVMPSLFPDRPHDFVRIFGATWRWESLGVLITVAVLVTLLILLLTRTKFGLAMRGVASNPDSARLVGVRTGTMLAMSWALAGALGAFAGALCAGIVGEVTPGLMFGYFVYAAAAATLGGFDSIGGALVSGLAIGVLENMAAGYVNTWIGNQMRLSVALIAIFVVLMIRPSGLFGSARVERV